MTTPHVTMDRQRDVDERSRRSAGDDVRQRVLAGIPVMERRLQLAGVSTAVLEGGDGPPVVLLHGGIECGGAIWAPVISRLAERHRLVVPDLPGLGESEPVARLDGAAFAEWFATLLRQTCAEKPALVAHSLGGSLAARFAAQHGDLLRRLVICGAPGIGPYRVPPGLMVAAIRFSLRPSLAPSRFPTRSSAASTSRPRCCGACTTGWLRSISPRRQARSSTGCCT